MPILLIAAILLLVFGMNNYLSILLEEQVLSAFGGSINFLFSWGYIEFNETSTFSSLYNLLNIMKTIFWLVISFTFVWQIIKRYKKPANISN